MHLYLFIIDRVLCQHVELELIETGDISDKQMFVFLSTNMNIVNKVLCNW